MKFQLPKNSSEIISGSLMPEDWYLVTLIETPTDLVPNRKMRESDGADPKSGFNLPLKLKIVSENEAFNGRVLTHYLLWPSDRDEGQYDQFSGQPVVDKKCGVIVDWYKAFNGIPSDEVISIDEVEFLEGQQVQVFVIQQKGFNDDLVNSTSMNHSPLPAEPRSGKAKPKK